MIGEKMMTKTVGSKFKNIGGLTIPKKSPNFTQDDIDEVRYCLESNLDISHFYERISWRNLVRIMFTLFHDLSINYFRIRANGFSKEREIISLKKFYARFLDQNVYIRILMFLAT